jgi:hypothetical protein
VRRLLAGTFLGLGWDGIASSYVARMLEDDEEVAGWKVRRDITSRRVKDGGLSYEKCKILWQKNLQW